jgi:hypothetical protein
MKTLTALLLAGLALQAQDKKARPKVDPVRVGQAIQKGVAFLKGQIGKYGTLNPRRSEELILWTLVHAGLGETDPDVAALLKTVTETPLQWTYNVSLQAMILEELDRVKWQARLAECAQFLADNQCQNGQWSYGEPTTATPDIPTGGKGKDVASGGGSKKPSKPGMTRTKPKVTRKIPIQKTRDGKPIGDNSNSQYASLGLRACHDAGIVFPESMVALADKWWRDSITGDGGWGYLHKNDQGYGSMTAGALGGILICDYMQNRPWMKDKDVLAGIDWITKHFKVDGNPESTEAADQGGWHYYWLYALERAGIFYGTEKFGPHEWYVEGANLLLGAQSGDGSWTSKGAAHPIWDTCFAILFLRRATRPLIDVASVDPLK